MLLNLFFFFFHLDLKVFVPDVEAQAVVNAHVLIVQAIHATGIPSSKSHAVCIPSEIGKFSMQEYYDQMPHRRRGGWRGAGNYEHDPTENVGLFAFRADSILS